MARLIELSALFSPSLHADRRLAAVARCRRPGCGRSQPQLCSQLWLGCGPGCWPKLNRWWIKLGVFLAKVVSPVALGILF
jgi:hypothetical protein